MFCITPHKIIITFLTCLLLVSTTKVFACYCVSMPNEDIKDAVRYATEQSTIVFAGKVIGFEYRKGISKEFPESRKKEDKPFDYETLIVKFQVERWWKGEVTTEVFLVTNRIKYSDGGTSFSSCDYVFKEAESYLVYAHGTENKFRTSVCMRTRQLNKTEDLKILGEGKEPIQRDDKTNKLFN